MCMLDGEGSTLHDTDKYTFAAFVHIGLNRAVSRCLLCMHHFGSRVAIAKIRF